MQPHFGAWVSFTSALSDVRVAGALYLAYVAIRILRSPGFGLKAGMATGSAPSLRSSAVKGMLSSILNPKALLFCSVLMPQFIDTQGAPVWSQVLLLGIVLVVTGVIFDLFCVFGASRLSSWLQNSPRAEAVAVALSWLENSGEEVFHSDDAERAKPRRKRKTDEEQIGDYVATLSEGTLRELLLEAGQRDLTLRDQLLFAAHAANASDLPSIKTAVRQATRISRPLDWREASAYGNSLMSLAAMLRQRLASPHAEQVVELAELAIAGAEQSLEQIDDSGGEIMPAIQELATVHLEACIQTRPDPVKLAERLFQYQMGGVWDTFYQVLPTYAEPLGDTGLAKYRTLVENAWDKQPPLAPSSELGRSYDSLRMRLEHAMTALAEVDGDIDALIRIRSKDLSSSYRFLLVAELCAQHGRFDEGLWWVERGLAKAGKQSDQRLLDFCIKEYLRRNELERADEYAWQRFEMRPTAEAFAALVKVAQSTGTQDGTSERALEYLWGLVKREESVPTSKRSIWQRSSRTELVKLFLAKRDNDAAWEAFKGGPVATDMWATMAAARSKTHPRDAIALYHRLLPIAVENGTRRARYEEAFDVVRTIAKLRAELNERAAFANELESIRETYRAKRNFIKLLATLGYSAA